MPLNADAFGIRRFRKKRCVYDPANTRDDTICFLRVSVSKWRSRRTGPRSVIQLATAPPVPLLTFLILWDGKAGREAGLNGRETGF